MSHWFEDDIETGSIVFVPHNGVGAGYQRLVDAG